MRIAATSRSSRPSASATPYGVPRVCPRVRSVLRYASADDRILLSIFRVGRLSGDANTFVVATLGDDAGGFVASIGVAEVEPDRKFIIVRPRCDVRVPSIAIGEQR